MGGFGGSRKDKAAIDLEALDLLTADDILTLAGGIALSDGSLTSSGKLIEVAKGTSGTPSGDAGLIIERGSSTNAALIWDETRDEFVFCTTAATAASTGDLTFTPANLSVERIGAGTEQAEAEVHAKRDTASGVTYSTTAAIISEDDTRPSFQLAGGANNIGLIQFGDNAAAASGQIYYDHSTDKLRIDCGGNGDRVTVDSDGNVITSGNLSVSSGKAVKGVALGAITSNSATLAGSNTSENAYNQTITVPADTLLAGDVIEFRAFAYFADSGGTGNNITFKIKMNASTNSATLFTTTFNPTNADIISVSGRFTIRSAATAGVVVGVTEYRGTLAGSAASGIYVVTTATNATTVSTDEEITFTATNTWAAGAGGQGSILYDLNLTRYSKV